MDYHFEFSFTDEETNTMRGRVIASSERLCWVFNSKARGCNSFAIVSSMNYTNIFGTRSAYGFSSGD